MIRTDQQLHYRQAFVQLCQLYFWLAVLAVLAVPAGITWAIKTYSDFNDTQIE